MADDTLFSDPKPDRFEHESPLRAFTEWNESGSYAIGKGLRPSAAHLPVYLDAIERKEGWRLVQMLLDDKGAFRSAIFHRATISPGELQDELIYALDHGGVEVSVVPEAEPADDPINPKHYDGTECAQIGERLTANCYQVLKYVWRLGEKDDPCIELGKALWYLEREINLGLPASRGEKHPRGLKIGKVRELSAKRKPLVQAVASDLWSMCYGFGTEASWREVATKLYERLSAEQKRLVEDGCCMTGLAI